MIKLLIHIFDYLESYWESRQNNRLLSSVLVTVFLITLLIGFGNYLYINNAPYFLSDVKFTDAIKFSFDFLLFFEMIGLVFIIPHSISNSIGRQFQIMSLIFLRTSFEELSNLSFNAPFKEQFIIISRMAADAGAALIIFILIRVFYSFQKHRQITDETEITNFISLKKIIALGVLAGLLLSVYSDSKYYLITGIFHPSYPIFYFILIFADMLLMLAAFKYMIHYPNIFRYSAFILITIFIRIALMAPVYYNAIIGIGTVLFGIGVTYVHNLFIEGRIKYLLDSDKYNRD